IIGINNRNLQTFETDVHTSLALSEHFQKKPVYISESAILTKTDAALVAPFFNGPLVGRALMQAENVAEKVKELQIEKGKNLRAFKQGGGQAGRQMPSGLYRICLC